MANLDPLAGTTLARYRIIERVGAGGMGEVYRAEDTLLRRFVALKVLAPTALADREATDRIYQEALAASALSHPNICAVYDFGTDKDRSFIVMELLEGRTLREHLFQSQLPLERTLSIARQAAEGLQAAHEKKIIHRDVKPANIFVTERGHVKVLDFGIAKRAATTLDEMMTDAAVADLTQDGTTFGTIGYMSTEQLRGEQIDARTDIFSFGSMLYEMLTGQQPFRADTSALVFDAILHRNPAPPSTLNSAVPPALDRIMAKMLQKNRDRRYRTFVEVVADLDLLGQPTTGILRSQPPPASTATGRLARARKREPAAARPIDSLAVLPFVNIGTDGDADYLSDGITDTIINKLSHLRALRVIPRTTAFRYKNVTIDPKTVSAELRVRAILVGRVLQRAQRLIVNAELIDAKKDAQLWGEQYNRSISDIFELQEHIAAEIARSLQLTLTGEDHKQLVRRDTHNPAAYQSYLRGRFYWNKRSTDGLRHAIEHFQIAIEQDSEYALAYVGLADTFNVLGYYNHCRPVDTYPRAKAAVARAIEIDSSMGEAYASLGYATLFFDRDWSGAERAFLEARRLKPEYASAHQWYGWWLMAMGRFDEMVQTMRRALELEPLSLIINDHFGYSLALAGRVEEAVQQLRATLELDPSFALSHQQLGFVSLRCGQNSTAIEHLETAVRLSSGRVGTALLGCAAGLADRREVAREMLDRLTRSATERFVSPLDFALVHAGLNEIDAVFDALGRAIDERVSDLVRLNLFPWPAEVRDDPRFEAVLRRVGISAGAR